MLDNSNQEHKSGHRDEYLDNMEPQISVRNTYDNRDIFFDSK